MDFNKLLNIRRSVRKYDKTKKVTKEQIEQIIESAILAPSWKNSQTARYYAVISDEMIAKFREKCIPDFNSASTDGAAYIVATFVGSRSGFERDGNATNELGNGWGCYDLGLQNMNLVLKAKELGLDTLIMGIRDCDAIRDMLNVPEDEIIVSVIAVGYGAVEPQKPKRKTADDILKFS